MTTQEFEKSITKSFQDGLLLIRRKNADYASSTNPFKNFESAGVVGLGVGKAILVRVLDKLARVSNLLENEAVVADEKIEDTILDAINYLAILKAYRESYSRVVTGNSMPTAFNSQLGQTDTLLTIKDPNEETSEDS